jgi:hypothetical protein
MDIEHTSASANLRNPPENLLIWTDSVMKRIILDGTSATGVQLIDGRQGKYLLLSLVTTSLIFTLSFRHERSNPHRRILRNPKTAHALRHWRS